MALSEIEKLERRYAENPQGLTFAPLAEVHRKNGEVRRALDLLGPGLELHPDYIPASIVLGRCHLDLGDVHAAETAFPHVLALDGENVIALKALADISERLLKFDEAERWLQHPALGGPQQRRRPGAAPAGRGLPAPGRGRLVGRAVERGRGAGGTEAIRRRWRPCRAAGDPGHRASASRFEPACRRADAAGRARDLRAAGGARGAPSPGSSSTSLAQLREPRPVRGLGRADRRLVGREVDTPDEAARRFPGRDREDIVLESAGGSEFQMPDASQELFASRGARRSARPFEEDAPVAPSAAWARPRRAASRSSESNVAEPTDESAAGARPSPEPTAPEPAAAEPYAPSPTRRSRSCPNRPRRSRSRRSSAPRSRRRTGRSPALDRSPESIVAPPGPATSATCAGTRTGTRLSLAAAPPKRSYSVGETRRPLGRPALQGHPLRPAARCRPRPPRSGRPPAPAAPARPPVRPPTHSRSARCSARRHRKRHPPFRPRTRGPDRSPSTTSSAPRAPHPPRGLRAPRTPRTTTSTSSTPGSRT